MGARRFASKTKNLEWYASEYEKAWGLQPLWQKYWGKNETEGFLALKRDYEVVSAVSFPKFQTCFNLIIALFGIEPKDTEVLRHVMQEQKAQGLLYSELRIIIPPRFNPDEVFEYLTHMSEEVLSFSSTQETSYRTRLVISLPRQDELLDIQYALLKDWMKTHQELAHAIVAIDFCHIEEGYPPEKKKEFCRRVRQDNEHDPATALAILYHVGESFQNMTLMSSIRWVCEAWEMGVHRLGHAISLGVDPSMYLHQPWQETIEEEQAHHHWLSQNANWLPTEALKRRGQTTARRGQRGNCAAGSPLKNGIYDENQIEDIRILQNATINHLKEKGALIESCPLSNFRIGGMKEFKYHPLQRFLQEGLRVVISSDDPGIFASNLNEEFRFCSEKLGISNYSLARCKNLATQVSSEKLVRQG